MPNMHSDIENLSLLEVSPTLLRAEFYLTSPEAGVSVDTDALSCKDLRRSEQELLVLHSILIPTTEEYGLQAINDALLLSQGIDGMRPEPRDELHYGVGTSDNASVRPIVHGELEGFGRRD